MNDNTQRLAEYLDHLQQPYLVDFRRYTVPFKATTRLCLQCGSPYTIWLPYEDCNPETRDLCDDCLLQPTTTTTTTKKLSGSGSGTGSVGKFRV